VPSGSNPHNRLAPSIGTATNAAHNSLTTFKPLAMRSKALFNRPLQDDLPYPPMEPPPPQASAFLDRVYDIAQRWVQEEWRCIEAIKRAVKPDTPPAHITEAMNEARLTPTTLANQLDNMSISALKRELSDLDAPPPGRIIRTARIRFAMHLLTHTRLKIHQIAQRAGYADPEKFAVVFFRETQCLPRVFRKHAKSGTGKQKSTGRKPGPKHQKPRRRAQKP